MTKRDSMFAALAVALGFWAPQPKGIQKTKSGEIDWSKPREATVYLNSWKSFTFHHDGKTVTLEPKEIFDALSSLDA